MPDEKLHPPPKPTTPREAPWTDLEQISAKLSRLIELFSGVPPSDDRLTVIIDKLTELIELFKAAPTPQLLPITTRLDQIIERLKYGNMKKLKPGYPYVVVQSISSIVLDENPNRIYALLINDSDTDIYLSLDIDAKLNEGIRLTSYGGAYEIDLLNPFRGKVYGICSLADKRLLVTEAE